MGRRSKEKGARFERKICRVLSLWWSGGKTDRVFWRSPTFKQPSGAVHQCGDVIQIDANYPPCPCVFELKHHKNFRVEDFLTGKKGEIVSWWEQTLRECPEGRIPVLIAHRDRGPTIVVTTFDCGGFRWGNVCISTLERFLEVSPAELTSGVHGSRSESS